MSNVIPSEAPSVFTKVAELSTLEKNAIVRPINPPFGIAGFVFDIVSEDSIELASDITDHFVENNSSVQDQIALKPETVTVRGLVGELVLTEQQLEAIQNSIPPDLPANPELDLELTAAQMINQELEQQEETRELSQSPQDKTLFGSFSATSPINPQKGKQARAFGYFYELWKGRQLFTVDTPWGFFTSMAIQSLRASQDEESKLRSEFTVTFKKIRFADEVTVQAGQLAGRAAVQSAKATNNGAAGEQSKTTPKAKSWLARLFA